MSGESERCALIERSISKKYRKTLWNPFIMAVKKYELIKQDDRIAVCISGGKDSMLMAKLIQMLCRYSEVPFDAKYLVMDPGYSDENRRRIIDNANILDIPIDIFDSNIFKVTEKTEKSPCYMCARMRRGYLYSAAKARGCNKIALGHHFNDVVETTVMSMFYASQIQTMPPKLHSTNFEGMELIRPLYCIHEDNIIAWTRYNKLEFLQCACHFTEDTSGQVYGGSKRKETKELLRTLKKTNPNIEKSIFHSTHDVRLDTMIGYKSKGEKHSFLDTYDD